MLAKHGLALDAVELVNVNFALSPALLSGQVDGVIGAFRNFELNQLALEGRPGRAFYPEEEGVPVYDELIFIANARAPGGRPRCRRFLDAVEAGALYLINHPDESFALFTEGRPELDDELNRRAWADTLPRFALRPAALDHARYARFAAFLEHQGLIKTPPPVETYAVELARSQYEIIHQLASRKISLRRLSAAPSRSAANCRISDWLTTYVASCHRKLLKSNRWGGSDEFRKLVSLARWTATINTFPCNAQAIPLLTLPFPGGENTATRDNAMNVQQGWWYTAPLPPGCRGSSELHCGIDYVAGSQAAVPVLGNTFQY